MIKPRRIGLTIFFGTIGLLARSCFGPADEDQRRLQRDQRRRIAGLGRQRRGNF